MTNELILPVARKLRPLLGEIVFLGGSVVELLLTDPAALRVRYTKDVDFIASIAIRLEYEKLGTRLKHLGFREDTNSSVICRWTDGEYIVDAMPINEEILGFSNPWYALAFETAVWMTVQELNIRVIRGPEFVASKLSAFKSGMRESMRYSHDLEDILLVIDGREELINEIHTSQETLRDFLQREFGAFINNQWFGRFLGSSRAICPKQKASFLSSIS